MSKERTVEEIIKNSGNSFHCNVVEKLKELDWHTLISPYYMDSATNKPREIDLVAEKSFKFGDGYSERHGALHIKLFIECKFIPNKVVFWFDEKNRFQTKEWLATKTCLRRENAYIEKHRYLTTNSDVAKLFAGETGRDQENEVMYKALNQCLSSMVSNRWGTSIIQTESKGRKGAIHTVEYPVILCNSFDKFYKVSISDQSNPEKIEDNFQLEVNYAYMGSQSQRNEYFLIDVVSFDRLKSFIEWVESDVNGFITMLS